MPVYPLMITASHFLIPNWLLSAKLISILGMALTTVPLYMITRDLFGHRAAFWAALAFAVSPFPNDLSMSVVRGPVFLFFFAMGVYYALNAMKSLRPVHFLGSFFFSLCAVLFRIESIIFLPLYPLFLTCLAFFRREDRKELAKGLLIFLLPPLALLSLLLWAFGADVLSLHRLDQVRYELSILFNLDFLDRYHNIYAFLKASETAPAFSGWRQNFCAIARHYLPLIYMIGTTEVFVKAIFPPFALCLAWGIGKPFSRGKVFLLTLAGCFFLTVYYSHVMRDYISVRFMLIPAFLSYPWIGEGLRKIMETVRNRSMSRMVAPALLALLLILPLSQCFKHVTSQPATVISAGEWLARIPLARDAKIVTTDTRIPFYAGDTIDFSYYDLKSRAHDRIPLERFALDAGANLIVYRASARRRDDLPEFKHYKRLTEFTDKRNLTVVYAVPGIFQTREQAPPKVAP